MNRRMWHRDDACMLVVSGKPFVEEIDSVSSSVLHGTVVVGGETFPDALITSPTLFLDVEACIPRKLTPGLLFVPTNGLPLGN